LLVFLGAMLLVELGVADALARLGRRLEIRLRAAFLAKIPRLGDRYFQSRPTSDMAERGHSLHQVRLVPRLAGQFARTALTLVATAAAIAWVDPPGALPALLAAALALGLPLAFGPVLRGLDLRVRTHAGALSRFYLDALLGLSAVRAHGAERAVRREHEGLLVEWARAGGQLLRWVVLVEGLQLAAGFGLAGWLLALHAGRAADVGGALLLAYWALSLPALGEEIARLARQYPTQRSVVLRLLEPLGAPDDEAGPAGPTDPPAAADDEAPFGRVLVVEAGRVVEDGPQAALAGDPGSRYRALLDAEHAVREGLWGDGPWRRLYLERWAPGGGRTMRSRTQWTR
jgi:ABC-type multidrug transport system fused ATPase/permease subunit